jgi:hypothetical protein
MKLTALVLSLLLSPPVFAASTDPVIMSGELDLVVCITSGSLSVRSDNLNSVLFSVKRGDSVKAFQGWGEVKKTKKIGGVTYTFQKLQFPDRPDNAADIGWVADTYIKNRSQCAGLVTPKPPTPPVTPPIQGINDPNCCVFPLNNAPKVNYTSGVASFGSSRSGGARKHAASDLYRVKGDNIKAVADGTVLRGLYYFYQGTYATEVRHTGGFVVRYGEVGSKSAVGQGKAVKAGQTVGYMGKTTCCQPMLHFELYSGAKTGALTTSTKPYQRRSDLMSPTSYLQKWQAKSLSVEE